jgi:hypothetical protein
MLHSYLYTETDELLNCRAHMETLRRDSNTEGMTDAQLESQHSQLFCAWYRDYVRHMSNKKKKENAQIICLSFLLIKPNYLIWTPCLYLLCSQVDHLDDRQRMAIGDKLVMHFRGPMVSAVQYNRYVVNEKLFRTIVHDVGKMSQNSGVCVLTVDGETYYEKLTQIIEVKYYDRTKYVLFKCD